MSELPKLPFELVFSRMADLQEDIDWLSGRLATLEEKLESRTMTGGIEGLPGTITVAGYEGGWAHIGNGVMVQETDGE